MNKRLMGLLRKQRKTFIKMDNEHSAGVVNLPNGSFAIIKKKVDKDWARFKPHYEILQELIFSIRPDVKEQAYGVVDYAVVTEAYDRMHKTTFLDRSQHKQIADFLSEFLTVAAICADKERTNKLIALIAWHMEQGGIPSSVVEDIDERFPEVIVPSFSDEDIQNIIK